MNTSLSLDQRIASAGQLAAGERAVADYLTENPEDAAVSSAAQLGTITGTSDATVIRTARKLGFDGLSELKRALVEHIARRRDPAKVLGERVKRLPAEGETVLEAVLGAEEKLLEQTYSLIPRPQWTETVRELAEASRIWVFGIGPSGTVAENFALALRRAGIDADSWTTTGFRLADELLRVRAEHAVVVIAPLRVFRETTIVLEHAGTVGAYRVLLTEAVELIEPNGADQVLRLPESTTGAGNELIVPLTLLHGLALELAARDSETAVSHHEELNTLRSRIAGATLDEH